MCLRTYVPCLPTCLRLLRGYVPCITTCRNFSGAYVPIYFLVPTCLHDLNYFLPTCTYFSRACVPKATQKRIEAQLCTSYCCFSMDYLTFHSILNPKTNSCRLNCIPQSYLVWFCYFNWCMRRDNNLKTH